MSALPVPRAAAYRLASAARGTPRRAAARRCVPVTTATTSIHLLPPSFCRRRAAAPFLSAAASSTPTAGDDTYLEAATRPSRFEESSWGPEEVSEVLLQAMRIQWAHGGARAS
jgi:hypothetical protein